MRLTTEGRYSLGTSAKSAAGPVNNDLGHVSDLDDYRRRAEHRQRWRLMRGAGQLLPFERVRECHRSIDAGSVAIMQDPESLAAHYSGVVTCGSRWHCPVCGAKITEGDRRKLQHAMALWNRDGGGCYLATFTFPHDLTMALDDSLDKMQLAQKRMKGYRAFKAIMAGAGAIGSVKALECTYGRNGWHPHVHMIVFARAGALDALGAVRALWARAVESVGLGQVNEHGFDIRAGDHAAEYVAKFGKEASDETKREVNAWWSASHELTKGHTAKNSRLGGATPFTLLRWYVDNQDQAAGERFYEFAQAFKGRAQLYWSPRLAKRLDLLELQQPEKPRAAPVLVLRLSLDDWHATLRHDARWELLYVAERYGGGAVAELLARMRSSRGRWRGDYKLRDVGGRQFPGYWRPEAMAA